MKRFHVVPSALCSAVCSLLIPASLLAAPPDDQEKEACATAFEQTQVRRQAGDFAGARAEATRCAASTCPAILVARCVDQLQQLEQARSTLIVAAQDDAGHARADARVLIDGILVADHLDGRPIVLDPGRHDLRLEIEGWPPEEQAILAREGEKDRRIVVTLHAPRPVVSVQPAPPRPVAPALPPRRMSAAPAIAAFAVGGVGLGVGALFGGLATAMKGSLDGVCPTPATCPAGRADDIATMKTQSTIATASFVAGGIAVGVGVALALVKRATDGAAARALTATPSGLGWRF